MKNKLNGFTLVEMVISFGVLTILLTILLGIFGSILDVQLESKSRSGVDQDGKYIMAKLNYDMHNASVIVTPASPGVSASLTLTNSADSINYTYSLDLSNNLQIVNNSTSEVNVLNSNDVTIPSISFQRIGIGGVTDTIRVTYTVQSKIIRPAGLDIRIYQTTLGLP